MSQEPYNDPLLNQFKQLVAVNNVNGEALKLFLKELPYEKFSLFSWFKMHVRQQIYSSYDLQIMANVVSFIANLNHMDISKVFDKRVSAINKEKSLIAHIHSFNCWQLLKNAIYEPIQLNGSILREDTRCRIANEEFEEINASYTLGD